MSGSNDPSEHEIDRRLNALAEELAREAASKQQPRRPRARLGRRPSQDPWQRPRKSRWRALAWAPAIVILAAAAWLLYSRMGTPSPSVSDTAPVTNGPVPATSPAGPPADPFSGTPADSYADGKAGIVVPAAHRVGPFTAGQVRAAYRDARKLLIASNLDPRTLRGGSPDALAKLLTPQERSYFVSHLDKVGLNKQGFSRSTRYWVTSFAPGTTQLIGSTIKVHGTMSARTATRDGTTVLRIHVDYLFVYAVMPPGDPAHWMRIVARNYGDADFLPGNSPSGPFMHIWNEGGTSGGRCGINDGFIHPDFPSGPPDKVKPSGAPINPYAQNVRPVSKGCQATTGT